ncbi:MAG TPA: tyrosine-protein phosphatase [Pseudolysinimonas sp.]|nr:tyrosine-protein phosphatase [Pseudolysinimonas sp.]
MRCNADLNARPLGGLPLAAGGETLPGIWRSATPDGLDASGWREVTAAGVGRIIDLRNEGEYGEAPNRPAHLELIRAPLEDPQDPDYTALWDRNWAIADFYLWGIARWPGLWATALAAVADAPPGAVLIHCAGGRDRTGVMSAVLLDAAGVTREAVLEDYRAGMRGTNEMLRRQGQSDHQARIPEDRMDEILGRFGGALDRMLDHAPAAFETYGLDEVLSRAARRLLPTS